MGNRKRRRRHERNSSDSDLNSNSNLRKKTKGEEFHSDHDVSTILKETNAVLYNQSNTSVFESDIDATLNLISESQILHIHSDKVSNEGEYSRKGPCESSLIMENQTDPKRRNSPDSKTSTSDSAKIDYLVNSIKEMKKNQEGMRRMTESKIHKLRQEWKEDMDTRIRVLRDDLSMDLGKESARLDSLLITVQSLQSRVHGIENVTKDITLGNIALYQGVSQQSAKNDNSDLMVFVTGLHFSKNEDMVQKARDLMLALGEDVSSYVSITAASRLPSRVPNRPGPVKITFNNTDEKAKVLKHKMSLKIRALTAECSLNHVRHMQRGSSNITHVR